MLCAKRELHLNIKFMDRPLEILQGVKSTDGSEGSTWSLYIILLSSSPKRPYRKQTVAVPERQSILIECMILFHILRRVSPFVRSTKSSTIKGPRFPQRLALSHGRGGVGLGRLAPVALSLACCGLLQMPLPSRD